MLGDAAHLMSPFAGEGVNMAMLDALELSKALLDNDYTDTLPAIAVYEKQMRARAAEASKQSMDSLIAMHSANAIKYMLNVIGIV
jgi:2-polyprenyl-6-methoxyphenol hydroxylase-like FAD-dependent oxidoreductase